VLDKQFTALDRAHSVLFLIIRQKAIKLAVFKRKLKNHPLLGDVGFMHVTPLPPRMFLKPLKIGYWQKQT